QYCTEHKTCNPSPYKELLLNAYADSFYGKLLANPDHIKEINLASKDAEKLYKEAYDLYKKENYHSAKQMVDKWLIEHKDHALHDKVRFLQLLIVGHMQPDLSTYQTMIKLFLDDFPKSPLHAQAEAILRKVTEELNGN
ncbi:MAG: hypothetical protein NZ521_04865, partial [Flammeovirgaceae bacterium]|nr:hypothetical protein [Flammeovirgaceae bacterium]MDW8287569.1 hypothetical protein [Flammeovirgaceae bacterium]